LKTASAKYKRPRTSETRSAATSCAATSATRRTRRTRVGRARRGARVTTGHCAAPAGTHPCRPWQVGRARWRWSTGGAPPVARHWPPEWRTLSAMPQPPHACKWHRHDPTYPQPTSRALISHHRPLLARTRIRPEPPPSHHWRRRCAPPSSRRPNPHKRQSPSLCTTKAPRVTCWSSRAARSSEPEFPRPPPDRHRRARPSADPPRPVTCLAPPLGHMEAPGAAHCWASPLPLPPPEFPRPHRSCATTAARRSPPRPNHRHQSITGEPNRWSP
jgi:hypothetical protein